VSIILNEIQELWGLCPATEKRCMVGGAHIPPFLAKGVEVVCPVRSSYSVKRLSYGLDGPGSNPGGYEIFRPSRPSLGPIQPPVQWVPGLSFPGVEAAGAWG